MIELNDFQVGFKKVNHNLTNDWNWEKIKNIVIKNTNIHSAYYRDLGEGGFTLGGLENDDYCKTILSFLHSHKKNYYARAGLYASTKTNSKSFSKHNDVGQYLWIWQIIGNTLWEVEDCQFMLNCNEMLYISPGLYHRAIPDSPRASITFSLEEFE